MMMIISLNYLFDSFWIKTLNENMPCMNGQLTDNLLELIIASESNQYFNSNLASRHSGLHYPRYQLGVRKRRSHKSALSPGCHNATYNWTLSSVEGKYSTSPPSGGGHFNCHLGGRNNIAICQTTSRGWGESGQKIGKRQ